MKANVNNIKLYREVNHRVRYYSIRLYKTLFGGYLLEKRFGGFKNKTPTGIIKEHYDTIDQGVSAIKNIIDLKLKKGYHKDKRQVRD